MNIFTKGSFPHCRKNAFMRFRENPPNYFIQLFGKPPAEISKHHRSLEFSYLRKEQPPFGKTLA